MSGRVKVVLVAEGGEEVVLFVLGPGELFGEIALLDSGPRTATVVALEPLETATLKRHDFLALLQRSPAGLEAVLAALAASLRRTTDELADLAGLCTAGWPKSCLGSPRTTGDKSARPSRSSCRSRRRSWPRWWARRAPA